MNVEELVGLWVRHKTQETNKYFDPNTNTWQQGEDWWTAHEEEKGCQIVVSDVRFETIQGGGCETCEHTYNAITYNAECTCPKIPGKKDPTKLRKDPNRFWLHGGELPIYDNGYDLSVIIDEMQEILQERTIT
jgi:hypothetical protein